MNSKDYLFLLRLFQNNFYPSQTQNMAIIRAILHIQSDVLHTSERSQKVTNGKM